MRVITLPVGEMGANCYIVCDGGGRAAVIDPGDEAPRILEAVRVNGLSVGAVLLTHAHVDHIGAVCPVVAQTGAPLFLHREDLPALNDSERNLSRMFGVTLPPIEGAEPLDGGRELTVGELTLTVRHTPGHTPGSCCFLCGSTLFSGDTLFCGGVGRTDFPGGNARALSRSLTSLLALPEETEVLPGHGEKTTVGRERRCRPYV